MAVYTKVSTDEAAVALQDYAIGSVIACDEIASGVENSNFFITTDEAKFVLTLYERRVKEEDIPYFLSLMGHLHSKNFPCPQPIADRGGKILQNINGRAAALFSFLQGQSITPADITPAHCRQVGENLAKLHLATADFKETRTNNLSYDGWIELSNQAAAVADRVRLGLAQKLNMELDYLRHHWDNSLPQGTCHADMFPDNIFFNDDKLCGIIDFYFACTDAHTYDLMITMNAWCFAGGQFQKTCATEYLQAYNAVRAISEQERLALPMLARGAALRFLLTRLVDWVNHDDNALVIPHDPMDFYTILDFHQGVKSCKDYGLE